MESVFARTEKYAAITYLFAPQRLRVNEKKNCTNILFALLIDEKCLFLYTNTFLLCAFVGLHSSSVNISYVTCIGIVKGF